MTPEDAGKNIEKPSFDSVAELAKPFLNECKRHGFEAVIMITDGPRHGYMVHVNPELEIFNSPRILFDIALAHRKTFQILTNKLSDIRGGSIWQTDPPPADIPERSVETLSDGALPQSDIPRNLP